MRSVYIHTCTDDCTSVGILSASMQSDEVLFEKAATARRAQGKKRPVMTRVGRVVERKRARLAKGLAKLLEDGAKKIAKQAARAYLKISKNADDDVQKILDELELEGIIASAAELLSPELEGVYADSGIAGVKQVLGKESAELTSQVNERAVEYAKERAAELVADLQDSTREMLRSAVTRAVEDGATVDELSDAVLSSGAFSEARADMIARTEIAKAHVEGNVQGWRETGEVEGKRSILGDLHDIEDICDDCADAGVVDLEDAFSEGADFPPYHPNCICDVVPVLRANGDEE